MTLVQAARTLAVGERYARRMLDAGDLERDHEVDGNGTLYVTRTSVAALAATRRGADRVDLDRDTLTINEAAKLTGLPRHGIVELADAGLIERIGQRVVTESLRRWAAGYRPDLLPVLG